MANFPFSLDTFTDKVDNYHDVMAADINDLQDAVKAIETLLCAPPLGWYALSLTLTYVSSTSFKITGSDVRSYFPKGAKIQLTQSNTTKYFYVVGSSFLTDTTVTVTGGSDYALADATITNPKVSYAAAPSDFPSGFNWAPVFTGFSVNPTGTHRFIIAANVCFIVVIETAGTSNSTTFEFTLPITPVYNSYIPVRLMDNDTIGVDPGLAILSNDGKVKIYKLLNGNTTTASGTKYVQFCGFYFF